MIGHSIIQDGQGFPYLSAASYYFLAGQTDKALSLLSLEDVGEHTKQVVTKVKLLNLRS